MCNKYYEKLFIKVGNALNANQKISGSGCLDLVKFSQIGLRFVVGFYV